MAFVPEKRDADGDSVGDGEGDDADGYEGCECGCGAEINETEQHLYQGDEGKGPNRDLEARVNDGEELGAGDGFVTGEGPSAARGGHRDADAAEHGDAEHEESESQTAAGGAHHDVEDVGEGLGGWRGEDVG